MALSAGLPLIKISHGTFVFIAVSDSFEIVFKHSAIYRSLEIVFLFPYSSAFSLVIPVLYK